MYNKILRWRMEYRPLMHSNFVFSYKFLHSELIPFILLYECKHAVIMLGSIFQCVYCTLNVYPTKIVVGEVKYSDHYFPFTTKYSVYSDFMVIFSASNITMFLNVSIVKVKNNIKSQIMFVPSGYTCIIDITHIN